MCQKSEQSEELFKRLVQEATLFDDWFLRRFMKDYPQGAELIIRICLGRKDLHVTELRVQEPFFSHNVMGKDGMLDVWAKDDNGEIYNIEVQFDNRGASPRRAFQYLSLMTQYELAKGSDYQTRPNCYVIFITRHDYFKKNEPYYWICGFTEDKKDVGIGAYILYINGSWRGGDELSYLVEDMNQPDPDKMHFTEISDRVRKLKTISQEEKMSGSLAYLKDIWTSEGRNQGFTDGRNQGIETGRVENMIQNVQSLMDNLKITLDEAVDLLKIRKEDLEIIKNKLSN